MVNTSSANKMKVVASTILISMFLFAFVYAQPVTASEQTSQPCAYQTISVQSAHRMTQRDQSNRILILDVRYQCEYDMGHLYGAVLIPYDLLQGRIDELDIYKDREVIVYCKSGYRSQIASGILASEGFAKVYNMEGGILAWIQAGYRIYTTSYYATVNMAYGDVYLQIDPWLLHQTGAPPCTQTQGSAGCTSCTNNTFVAQNTTVVYHSEVLKQDAGQLVIQTTFEAMGEVFEIAINNTILWSYDDRAPKCNRSAGLFLTTMTWNDVSTQFYNLVYDVRSVKYNLTVYTLLVPLPLDSDVYAGSTTVVKCAAAGNSATLSSEFVEFNSSLDSLSHQYDILGYVAHRIGGLYEKSHDESLTRLAPSYTYMRNEIQYLSRLVRGQIPEYDKVTLRGTAYLVDPCDAILHAAIGGVCGLGLGAACAAGCSWAVAGAGIGYFICLGICLAAEGAFCSWLTDVLCGQPPSLYEMGCNAACTVICYGCPIPIVCYACGPLCNALCNQFFAPPAGGGGGGGGGGGCPILSVYDGSQYVSEGLLDIHASSDVVRSYSLIAAPARVGHQYLLRLTEHPLTISHLDQVKLFATLDDGTTIRLPLIAAIHSQWGNVLPRLRSSDNQRTAEVGAVWNGGTSQSIDLSFLALPPWLHATSFAIVIEGYNMIVK